MSRRETTKTGGRGTALVVARARQEDDDERLALEALDHISRLERRAKLELVIEVGDFLIDTFFGGDLELARSKNPTKPRALAHLERLAPARDVSPAQLRIAVSMSVQYRALPAAVRDRLSVRQYRALLPVADAREKSRLARRAVAEQLSGDALAQIVRGAQGPASRGRKPRAELVKIVDAARRVLVSADLEAALDGAKVRALDPAVRAQLTQSVRTLRERVERIADALARVRG